jgi:peptidoglycan-associated lipoprotein
MKVIATLVVAVTLASAPAWAQDSDNAQATRPATPTYWGDTGLWFVPTAEVLPKRTFSFSVYRTEFDFKQGLTDVSDWPVTAAAGLGRAEIFGALRAVTRIDRDVRPLFLPNNGTDGGLVNDRPFVRETWTGNDLGDLFVGAKINLISEQSNKPVALAFRSTIKIPTADDEDGAGTGKSDYFADIILSKELSRRVELSGFAGYAFRGDPDDIALSDGMRWGVGAAFGARSNLRVTTELFGEHSAENVVRASLGTVTGEDGSLSPVVSQLDSGVTAALGLTWQHPSGMTLGAGLTYQFGLDDDTNSDPNSDTKRAVGLQFRLGFHRGVRAYSPPAPPAIAAKPEPVAAPPAPVAAAEPPRPAPPAANRPPTVTAQCDPCRIEVGQTTALRVDAQDPDGDRLTYLWSTPAGTIGDTRAASTSWRAETTPRVVALTVTAEDGRGGKASSTVNVEVVGGRTSPTGGSIAFDDVLFDLNRDVLRPEGRATLDRASAILTQNPGLRLVIEGHASEEATPEYNLALGERRAAAVRNYLVGNGVDASRLKTVSYGETRPRYDNSKEETRRLNRRAALVVAGQ